MVPLGEVRSWNNDGRWHHVAFMWDDTGGNGMSYVYVDAQLRKSGPPDDQPHTDTEHLFIGGHGPDGGNGFGSYHNFAGQLDDIAVLDIALTADDITAIYNGGQGLDLDPHC